MFKSKIFRRIALIISLISLITSTVNTTFGFIVTKTDSIINIFTPFESIVNALTITKSVEHPFGEDYVIPDDVAFDFEVALGSLYSETTIKTSAGDLKTNKDGKLTVSVKPNTPFVLNDIDADTKVTVTEHEKKDSGFTAKGGAVKEAVISKDGGTGVSFVNLYSPKAVSPLNLKVIGKKTLAGRPWQKGDTFSFLLEQKKGENWEKLGTKTISFDENNTSFNSFDFSREIGSLVFDKIGSYDFRMSEIVGNAENMLYDKTVNTFEVKVTDTDMDGKLEIGEVSSAENAKTTKDGQNYTVSVLFNNSFVPPAPIEPDDLSVPIVIKKTVKNTGDKKIGPEGFEFILESTANGEKLSAKSDKDGKAVLSPIFTARDAGNTYSYKLYEADRGAAGVTYDKTEYNVTVKISLEGEKLTAAVTMDGKSVKTPVAEFKNVYSASSAENPDTGENNALPFWFTMMVISAAAVTALILLEKKYKAAKSR